MRGVMCVFLGGGAWFRWELVTPGQGVGSPPAGADKDKRLDYLGGFPGVQKPYLQQKSSCSSYKTLISFWLSLMFIGHFNCTSNRRSKKPVDLTVTKGFGCNLQLLSHQSVTFWFSPWPGASNSPSCSYSLRFSCEHRLYLEWINGFLNSNIWTANCLSCCTRFIHKMRSLT